MSEEAHERQCGKARAEGEAHRAAFAHAFDRERRLSAAAQNRTFAFKSTAQIVVHANPLERFRSAATRYGDVVVPSGTAV